jgi:type I pantothenate kinase
MSRLLREMLSRFPENPSVALVSTTGSSLPNAELERGLMEREGLPPSRSTVAQCCASCTRSSRASRGHTLPVYSHLTYDIVPDARIVVCAPPTSSSSRD